MPLFERHPSLLLAIWKIKESVPELLTLFDANENDRFFPDNIRVEARKKEYLVTRLLLKELFGCDTEIAHHADGAPYLPENPALSISITHTKGYVAVYCDATKRTGIDIEYKAERVQKIKHKFMSDEELASIDLQHQTEHLLIYWCAKETLFKLIRQQEVDFRQHLHVKPFAYKEEGEIEVRETRTPQQETFILEFRVTPEFVLTFNK